MGDHVLIEFETEFEAQLIEFLRREVLLEVLEEILFIHRDSRHLGLVKGQLLDYPERKKICDSNLGRRIFSFLIIDLRKIIHFEGSHHKRDTTEIS